MVGTSRPQTKPNQLRAPLDGFSHLGVSVRVRVHFLTCPTLSVSPYGEYKSEQVRDQNNHGQCHKEMLL
jgi:hypothetical protein